MANFILSAFADEIDSSLDKQIESLKRLSIDCIEIRTVDGKSFVSLSDDEVKTLKKKLSDNHIKISALASPVGKIRIDGDFAEHKKLFMRIMDIGDMLGCKRIRIFSFYKPFYMSETEFREKSFEKTEELLELAEKRRFTLCHENEKDIYGCSIEREYDLLSHFNGRLRAVLDSGNFAFCGFDASKSYDSLKEYIEYFHIKDALYDGTIVPAGTGKACIKNILQSVNSDRKDKDVIITIEPHLTVFDGLSSLSDVNDIKHKYSFKSPFEAFKTSVDAVRKMIAEIE